MIKKIITTAVLGVSALAVISANAADPGVYVTGQMGYANTHLGKKAVRPLANSGIAGRLAVGYQATPNWAIETGYLHLPSKNNTTKDGKDKSSEYAFDVAAKGILPLTSNVNLYGKVGAAYVSQKLNVATVKTSLHKWAPEVAVGVSYDLTPNLSLDTSWTHIHANRNKANAFKKIQSVDFAAVGVAYNFG